MNPRRILIVNVRSLLIEGVERLLKVNGEFVVNSVFSEDHAALVREIELLKPHVIIIDEITSFTEPARLIASLMNIQNIRLIVVNNRDSVMEVYDKYECAISHPAQFVEAVALSGARVNLQ